MTVTHTPKNPQREPTAPPQAIDGPVASKLKAKLSRRAAFALVVVLALLMAVALAVPPLAIALILVLLACAVFFIGDYAVFWFKHHPLPRHYDDKGRLQPNRIENVLIVTFAQWPLLAWAVLKGGNGLNVWWLLGAALIIPSYYLGKLALFRWWLPRKAGRNV